MYRFLTKYLKITYIKHFLYILLHKYFFYTIYKIILQLTVNIFSKVSFSVRKDTVIPSKKKVQLFDLPPTRAPLDSHDRASYHWC